VIAVGSNDAQVRDDVVEIGGDVTIRPMIARCVFLGAVVVCACGKVSNDTVDANLIDADQTGTLSVVTQTRFFISGGPAIGAAQPSVDVVSVRPNNTVADMVQTDASGHANLQVYPGGSITAVYKHPADMGADLVTYFGAKPNDVLTFGQRFSPTTATNIGSMTFSYPALGAASFYEVFGPCGANSAGAGVTSITLTEFTSCHRDPMDVVFIAFNAASQVMNYNYLSSVAFQNGGGRAIGGWGTAANAMVNVTGMPAEIQNLSVNFANVGNVEQTLYSSGVNGQVTGGAYTNSFPWATAGTRTEATLFMTRPGTFRTMQLHDAFQSGNASWTVAAPTLPPWLQTFSVSIADQMGIMYLVGDGPYDAGVFRITWNHLMGSTSVPFVWTFILPPQMTTFTFPALPAQFAAYLPQPQDPYGFVARIIEIPSIANYDALRAIPEKSLICPNTFVPDCALRNGEFQRIIYDQ
jgi:hypothetical protein